MSSAFLAEGHPAVGVIGLGRVGWPVAQSLVAAGLPVVGYQRRGSEALAGIGGSSASSPRDVIERCKIVFLALPSAAAMRDVVEGTDGLCSAGPREAAVVIDLSTTEYSEKDRARAKLTSIGTDMLDCPVGGVPNTGSPPRMDSLFGSGEKAVYDRCADVLGIIASRLWYVGDFGSGATMKLVANALVALHTIAAAEALALGSRSGLDKNAMLEVIAGSPGTSWVFKDRSRRMMEGPYTPARGSIDMMRKDLALIKQLANESGDLMPLLDLATRLYDTAADRGWGDHDVSAMYCLAAGK